MKPENRIGRFTIPHRFVDECRDKLGKMFAEMDFVCVRAESRFDKDCIEYAGFSPMFAPCEEGSIAPEYHIGLTASGRVIVHPDIGERQHWQEPPKVRAYLPGTPRRRR